MRVFISVDMEGVAGVAHEDQTDPTDPRLAAEYERSRRLMTAEANAAVGGAFEAGATRVVVSDSHWLMRNIAAEELHPEAELVSGGPRRFSMMEGIQEGFDAALCVGYHGMAGTANATIDHTYTSRVQNVRLNGRPVGELGLNAALAGTFGVPVVMVSGDRSLAAEAKALLGDGVEALVVKEAVSRFAARSITPTRARAWIGRVARDALSFRPLRVVPLVLPSPIALEVDFVHTHMADMAELVPGSTRPAGRTVRYVHDDYREVFRAFRAFTNLSSVRD
jgi:D-amino peptidase